MGLDITNAVGGAVAPPPSRSRCGRTCHHASARGAAKRRRPDVRHPRSRVILITSTAGFAGESAACVRSATDRIESVSDETGRGALAETRPRWTRSVRCLPGWPRWGRRTRGGPEMKQHGRSAASLSLWRCSSRLRSPPPVARCTLRFPSRGNHKRYPAIRVVLGALRGVAGD